MSHHKNKKRTNYRKKNKATSRQKVMSKGHSFHLLNNPWFWAVAISLVTLILYVPVFDFDFVNWDDDRYVTDNPYITDLSWENIRFFFTDIYFSMYLPVTLLTYAIDYHFSGMDASIYHITSVVFHLFNTALVFWFIYKLMKMVKNKFALMYAIIVATLFGIHTIHVESVAWIAERKDVTYTFFYFICLLFYLQYIRTAQIKHLLLSLLMFFLSLISKAQAMPLAVVLILIDYFLKRDILSKKVIFEKVPFFVLAIIFGIIAILATRQEGASSNAALPFHEKIVYGAYSLTTYVIKMIVPYKLSAIYPYPEKPGGNIQLIYYFYLLPASALLASIVLFWKKLRPVVFGIGFYVVNIFIVLQIFAYHNFIIADRYTYVSSVGIYLLFGFIYEKLAKKKYLKYGFLFIFILSVAVLFAVTRNRQQVWENSLTLWEDVRSKHPNVIISYYNAANHKMKTGKLKEAIKDYNIAIEKNPEYIGALSNRGICHARLNNVRKAIADFNRVIELDSTFRDVYSNRGNARVMLGDLKGAVKDYSKAIKLKPGFTDAYFNRGLAYNKLQKWKLAINDFSNVLSQQPEYKNAHYSRGLAYSNMNENDLAIRDFTKAISLNNKNIDAYYNRGVIFERNGRIEQAIKDYSAVISINPKIALPYFRRALGYQRLGQIDEACQDFNMASQLGMKAANEYINKICK
jgi:protein O-mannosyl-transferase